MTEAGTGPEGADPAPPATRVRDGDLERDRKRARPFHRAIAATAREPDA